MSEKVWQKRSILLLLFSNLIELVLLLFLNVVSTRIHQQVSLAHWIDRIGRSHLGFSPAPLLRNYPQCTTEQHEGVGKYSWSLVLFWLYPRTGTRVISFIRAGYSASENIITYFKHLLHSIMSSITFNWKYQ